MYIDSDPLLHVFDDSTIFSAALFPPNVSMQVICSMSLECWALIYTGLPNRILLAKDPHSRTNSLPSGSSHTSLSYIPALRVPQLPRSRWTLASTTSNNISKYQYLSLTASQRTSLRNECQSDVLYARSWRTRPLLRCLRWVSSHPISCRCNDSLFNPGCPCYFFPFMPSRNVRQSSHACASNALSDNISLRPLTSHTRWENIF